MFTCPDHSTIPRKAGDFLCSFSVTELMAMQTSWTVIPSKGWNISCTLEWSKVKSMKTQINFTRSIQSTTTTGGSHDHSHSDKAWLLVDDKALRKMVKNSQKLSLSLPPSFSLSCVCACRCVFIQVQCTYVSSRVEMRWQVWESLLRDDPTYFLTDLELIKLARSVSPREPLSQLPHLKCCNYKHITQYLLFWWNGQLYVQAFVYFVCAHVYDGTVARVYAFGCQIMLGVFL